MIGDSISIHTIVGKLKGSEQDIGMIDGNQGHCLSVLFNLTSFAISSHHNAVSNKDMPNSNTEMKCAEFMFTCHCKQGQTQAERLFGRFILQYLLP